jgi:uncharacterized protein involved in exopolysaccharide biosynthesis
MFRPDLAAEETPKAPPATPGETGGMVVDPRRILRAIGRVKRPLVGLLLGASLVGAVTAKLVLPKTYAAKATLLWEPPASAHTEGGRELTTLAQSVKLPTNLLAVRSELHRTETIEALAKSIDVTFADNSRLIEITGKDSERSRAAGLANAMVDVFLRAQRDVASNRLREVVLALRQSLLQSEKALSDSRTKYDHFRAEHHVDDFPFEIQGAIAETARLRVSAHDAEIELQGMQARESAFRHAQAASPTSVVMSQTEENTDASRLGRAETELSALRAKYSDDHPSVLALEAEVSGLKARARGMPHAVVGQTLGRNPVYDSLGAQLEESRAVRTAMAERARALGVVQREAELRATQLTAVQGEAARLLANVNANEEHVNVLLKQIAMAEDDVRVASSGFQLVSGATPPERAEKGFGRVVAIAVPALTALIALLVVVYRELRGMRIKTASEASYWGRAPVLASTSWPEDDGEPSAPAERYLADAFERRSGVVGIAPMGEGESAVALASAVVSRLEARGRTCVIIDARESLYGARGAALADAIEHRSFADGIEKLREVRDHVLVLLPTTAQPMALRASLRSLDSLLIVLQSGKVRATELAALRATLGLKRGGLGLALTHVPRDLLTVTSVAYGDRHEVWLSDEDPRATVRWSDEGYTSQGNQPAALPASVASQRALRRGAA